MRKSIKKKLWEGLVLTITAIFAMVLSVYVLLRDPFIQTFTARITAAYLSEQLQTRIQLNGFYLNTDLSLHLKGLVVYDQHDSILLKSEKINVQPASYDFAKKLDLKRVELEGVEINLLKHLGADDFNYALIFNSFSSDDDDTLGSRVYPIYIRNLQLQQAAFSYVDYQKAGQNDGGMDYSAIRTRSIFLEASAIKIDTNGVSANILKLKAIEQSGIELHKLHANVLLSGKGVIAKDLIIETPQSALRLDLELKYNNSNAFSSFVDSVLILADFGPSSLQMSDIGYFAPIMKQMPNLITFSGKFEGLVRDFFATDFSFSYGKQTSFIGSVEMKGLPDFYETDMRININRLNTNINDIQQFKLPIEGGNISIPSDLANPGLIELNGIFEGRYNDFLARSGLRSGIGSVQTDLIVRTNSRTGKISYRGSLKTKQLHLGKLTGQEKLLGALSMDIRLDGEGITLETANANVSGSVSSIELMDNTFNDINLKGELSGERFNGNFRVDDPKLKLDFDGLADFTNGDPIFDFHSTIHHADLYHLGLMNLDTIMHLSTTFTAAFTGFDIGSFLGKVELNNTNYADSRGDYVMQNFILRTEDDQLLNRKLFLNSDFLDLEIGGTFDFNKVAADFKSYVLHYLAFEAYNKNDVFPNHQDFYFNLKFKDTQTLSELLAPGITIASGASFSGAFTSSQQLLHASFQTDWLDISGVKLIEPYMNVKSNLESAQLNLDLQRISFFEAKDGDTSSFGMDYPILNLQMHQDSVLFGFVWDNGNSNPKNKGKIDGFYHHFDTQKAELKISHADIVVNDSVLKLQQQNRILFTENYINLSQFNLQLGKSSLSIEGNLPMRENDSLLILFGGWNLSSFDVITRAFGFDMDGVIDGDLILSNFKESPAFASNLHISDLFFNREKLGEARILSTWSNEDASIYVNTQIINTGNIASSRMLNLRGFYYPRRKQDNLSLELSLENFRLKLLNQFFVGIISKLEGLASGDIKIGGKMNAPEISGDLNLQRTSFIIDYLNVAYSIQHQFKIEPNRIMIEDLYLLDTLGNQAVVQGVIRNENLRNFSFDISIRPERLLALNTGPLQNELFYGSAIVTGEVLIRGPLNQIEMGIRAISQRGTSIVIPLNNIGSVATNDYIRFVNAFNRLDDLESESKTRVVMDNGFEINLETVVTPDAALQIFMPYNMGNLQARGAGNLSMAVNNAGDFSLNGDYVVQNGQFNFSFENLIKKKFDLLEGGRISWTGDPYDAEVDVKGVYKVKASLAGLGLDSTSSLRNRVNVDCIIHLSNQLFNPDIRFSFALPGSDPQVEQLVFSVIDTTNDALMTQQMISLLVLGSFSYSAIDNFSIGSTSFDMLSGQLSNWLSQISNDFDIGLHYRPGDNLTSEELEVALSTQLFNDRVTIDGNFGVINNRNTTQNASNIVGDFDISVKLTQDGRLLMKAFNHSNANNLITASSFDKYAPYTQGIGLSFRQEFDSFTDIFRKRNKKKKNDSNDK